jgi:hypothetical protein
VNGNPIQLGKRQAKKFRRRFRLPFQEWRKLVEKVKEEYEIFGGWLPRATSLPIELLIPETAFGHRFWREVNARYSLHV